MPIFSYFPDEWWPIITLTKEDYYPDRKAEFTEEEVKEIRRIEEEFNSCRRRIEERFGLEDRDYFRLIEETR